MKYKHTLIAFFIFLFVVDAQAQQYEPPSREQVQQLLDDIEECKDYLERAKGNLQIMEDNPGQVSLKTYRETKRLIKVGESCIAEGRKLLDELRKDYPGWFNSPNATIALDKGHTVSPKEIERIKKVIEDILASANLRLADIVPPEE